LGFKQIKIFCDSYIAALGLHSEKDEHALYTVKCAIKMSCLIKKWQESQQAIGK